MIQNDLFAIGLICGIAISFTIIYIISLIKKPYDGVKYIYKEDSNDPRPSAKEGVDNFLRVIHNKSEEVDPVAEKISEKDDIINHSGVGIVYRPTTEELERMSEPQMVKEAKEEVAKSLSQAFPPEI